MLLPHRPWSNLERQREFRERNPGYFNKYNARRRAAGEAAMAASRAAALAAAATPAPAEPLALPAPVEIPVIPGVNTIAAMPAPQPERCTAEPPRSAENAEKNAEELVHE